jgi:hypothetical protein
VLPQDKRVANPEDALTADNDKQQTAKNSSPTNTDRFFYDAMTHSALPTQSQARSTLNIFVLCS